MNLENRILLLSGLGLTALTMFFGFWYAIFDEHQTLNAIGFSLATGFMEAANGNIDQAYAALDQYGALNGEYRKEIHFHGHFGFLGLALILIGLVVHRLGFSDKTRAGISTVLAVGAFLFPFGVFLQIGSMAQVGKVFAVIGTIGLVLGTLGLVTGLLRRQGVAGAS